MLESSLYGKNILIVDDDRVFNLMVEDMLSTCHANPVIATSIKEALSLWKKQHFDFILLDGHLPDGDAQDFIKNKEIYLNNTLLFLITSDNDQSFIHYYFTLGVSDCLLKPINLDLLWLKMERHFESHIAKLEQKKYHKQVKNLLLEKQKEEELARYVYAHLTKNDYIDKDIFDISMLATSQFNGDFFIATQSPSGSHFAMLLDATGHGLAASITILPLVSILKAMVSKGFALPNIVYELNDKLCYQIPDDRFVAAIIIEINSNNKQLSIWNGGMPGVLMVDTHCQIIDEHHSAHMPLGIIQSEQFDPTPKIVDISGNEGLILYSDGLTEQENLQGKRYGEKRLRQQITKSSDISTLKQSIMSDFKNFVQTKKFNDDVSLCCINCASIFNQKELISDISQTKDIGEISIQVNISGLEISEVDILEFVTLLCRQVDLSISKREKVFTVCSELINNSIDHGILNLDSKLKNDFQRFDEYLNLRNKRLKNLSPNDKVELELKYSKKSHELSFMITDSGKGYDSQAISPSDINLPSGKGLKLINALSDKYYYNQAENLTSVIIK